VIKNISQIILVSFLDGNLYIKNLMSKQHAYNYTSLLR